MSSQLQGVVDGLRNEGRKRRSVAGVILEASLAYDKARNLPACRPERVTELLWDWAMSPDTLDINKVQAELRYLYSEQFAEERRQQVCSGSE